MWQCGTLAVPVDLGAFHAYIYESKHPKYLINGTKFVNKMFNTLLNNFMYHKFDRFTAYHELCNLAIVVSPLRCNKDI
jgi:hypothetical protein